MASELNRPNPMIFKNHEQRLALMEGLFNVFLGTSISRGKSFSSCNGICEKFGLWKKYAIDNTRVRLAMLAIIRHSALCRLSFHEPKFSAFPPMDIQEK